MVGFDVNEFFSILPHVYENVSLPFPTTSIQSIPPNAQGNRFKLSTVPTNMFKTNGPETKRGYFIL